MATAGPELSTPLPDIEPRFGGAFSYLGADEVYAFKGRGFGEEIGVSEFVKIDSSFLRS